MYVFEREKNSLAPVTKHATTDVWFKRASTSVYVCVCSSSWCGCRRCHRCSWRYTAVSMPHSHLQTPVRWKGERAFKKNNKIKGTLGEMRYEVSAPKDRCFPRRPWVGFSLFSTAVLRTVCNSWFTALGFSSCSSTPYVVHWIPKFESVLAGSQERWCNSHVILHNNLPFL